MYVYEVAVAIADSMILMHYVLITRYSQYSVTIHIIANIVTIRQLNTKVNQLLQMNPMYRLCHEIR